MITESEAVAGPIANPPHPGELVRHDCLEPLKSDRDGGSEGFGRVAQNPRQPRQRTGGRLARDGGASGRRIRWHTAGVDQSSGSL